ncbi:hypothetical protein ACFQ48_03335 [Hymenobacter caeli]|uniref:Uncharacterized protein n=1 Tax=Hymenobacter caeli TaxID=2735894 RepID=A0ABX2FLJ7_9BACT|nr:hypothetical protein [Hymenobacter caeli]NRT17861.1 hypothetical protein [Hymenobacter caeli]
MTHAPALFPAVAPELLARMHFPDDDVLATPAERYCRAIEAAHAAVLGSTYRGKLALYFLTADGAQHRLQACVWAVDDDVLVLQKGAALPLRAVLRLEFS